MIRVLGLLLLAPLFLVGLLLTYLALCQRDWVWAGLFVCLLIGASVAFMGILCDEKGG